MVGQVKLPIIFVNMLVVNLRLGICLGLLVGFIADLFVIGARFSHLKEWLGVSVFSAPNIKDTKNEFTVTLKKPLEKEIRLNELTLDIKGTWKYNGGNHFGSLNTDAKISIYCQKTGLQKIFKIIYAIRNFLRLTTGENIAVLSIIADELGTQIEIFVPNLIEEKKSQYRFSFCPVPIEFDQISEGLEVYLQNWFLFIEKFEPVYQLFFGVMDKKLYAVSEFLSLSQAIEAYHSRKYNNRLFPDEFIKIIDNFTQFSKMVTENLPDDPAKSAFRDKIKFINRKSLRMRTRELFSENIDVFKIFIEDETTFISKFVEARNFYTHYDPKMKAPIEQAELLSLTEELRLIIITLLLKEIEFKELDIKKIVSSYCRYKIKKLYSLF